MVTRPPRRKPGMKTRSASSWVCRVIEGMGDGWNVVRWTKSVQRFLPPPFPSPRQSYVYVYIYIASVDIVAFEQMRTFGVRWRVDMAVGWFQMILDLQGWIKKEGGIHGKVKWISRDSPSFSSPPFPSVSPISSPILLSFPCFLRTTLCRRISFIRWTRSRENAGKGERRKINLQGRIRRGRKIPREGEFQCGS